MWDETFDGRSTTELVQYYGPTRCVPREDSERTEAVSPSIMSRKGLLVVFNDTHLSYDGTGSLQVPSRGVSFADAVEHRAVLGVNVDAKGVFSCDMRWVYVVDKNRYEEDVIVGDQISSSGRTGWQFAELLHSSRCIQQAVKAHGVRELIPECIVPAG